MFNCEHCVRLLLKLLFNSYKITSPFLNFYPKITLQLSTLNHPSNFSFQIKLFEYYRNLKKERVWKMSSFRIGCVILWLFTFSNDAAYFFVVNTRRVRKINFMLLTLQFKNNFFFWETKTLKNLMEKFLKQLYAIKVKNKLLLWKQEKFTRTWCCKLGSHKGIFLFFLLHNKIYEAFLTWYSTNWNNIKDATSGSADLKIMDSGVSSLITVNLPIRQKQ